MSRSEVQSDAQMTSENPSSKGERHFSVLNSFAIQPIKTNPFENQSNDADEDESLDKMLLDNQTSSPGFRQAVPSLGDDSESPPSTFLRKNNKLTHMQSQEVNSLFPLKVQVNLSAAKVPEKHALQKHPT